MKGFSSVVLIISIAILILISFQLRSIEIEKVKEDRILYEDFTAFINEQQRIYELGKRDVLLYCGGYREFNLSSIFEVDECNISYKGIRSKNCYFEELKKAKDFFSKNVITSSNIDEKLNEYVNNSQFQCNYQKFNFPIAGCDLNTSFRINCSLGEIETKEGIKRLEIRITGGVE